MCILNLLTLRALSLFFKILPISKVGDCIAYILATIPQTWLLFRHEVLLPPTWTRKSPSTSYDQIKCSVLPLLTGTGANKMTPLHVGTSYTHDFRFHSKGNASGTHQSTWTGSHTHKKKCELRGRRGGTASFKPRINAGTPPFKIPPVVVN